MNVQLSNEDYAKLAEQAQSQGKLTEQLGEELIVAGLNK